MTLLSVSDFNVSQCISSHARTSPWKGACPYYGQPDGEPRRMQEYRTAHRVFAFGLLRRHVLDRLRDEP